MCMYTELIHYDLGSESSDTDSDTHACYLNQQKMLYIFEPTVPSRDWEMPWMKLTLA